MSEPSKDLATSLHVLHQLPPMPGHPCAYLPGQIARDRGFVVSRMSPDAWQVMLENGWRRAGMMIYEPACPFCRQCIPLRIPITRFRPSRTQRKCWNRNQDLEVRLTPVLTDEERYDLYRRYITIRHNGMMTGSRREFEQFLGMSPVETCEIEYRLDGRLVAVATTDRFPGGWSSVYCYYDPEESRRSLGTFNVLMSIELCRDELGGHARLYLGYWVENSSTMAYKSDFQPFEYFDSNRQWRPSG